MAKEITTKCSCSIAAGGSSKTAGDSTVIEDLTGGCAGFRQTISDTAEAIALGADVATPKVVFIQNLDLAHSVAIDKVIAMTSWPQKIGPGAAILLRPEGSGLFAQADATFTVNIWVVAG